jgi:ABC-type bacteriocin/lantibiotic exporter with double-glycine peptidase domain
MELSRQLPSFIHVTTAVDRLAELYDMPLEERGAVRLEGELGVRVENVTFAYKEGENVLENFSYDFAAGRMTAILGHTGAGKSTLLRLILGLIDPQQGRALIYNSEREQPLSSRTRCNLGYVPQGNSLMSGTIRSNLLLGNPSATDEQMCKALHTAVADFVFDLPLGLDTPCSESGMGLSEGQAQRIAIARALLRDRSVMLMDEPTAALDTATEALLLQRLSSYASGRTMIIVTHHPSAAELCDAVVRVD